jgi:hypothetical protein
LAVEIEQRWFALTLFLRAGSIATHGGPMPALQGSGAIVAPFISRKEQCDHGNFN